MLNHRPILLLLVPARSRDILEDFPVDDVLAPILIKNIFVMLHLIWFASAFRDEIKALRVAFGADNVSLRWGIVSVGR